ncbi:kinase-like domain-containing protein [Radiomyces spectabilis]|uniref:kinase-like domain-containing protein n=1 Tax=Radiomyces spectabilis TaxID=64574 RepID=UPI0022210F1A|nr:kinase-like domain-containing protein [Radiomyces spectabilis]KAI8376457.1 kinase-like domain-containing protein [Radiomyces spectabilis]
MSGTFATVEKVQAPDSHQWIAVKKYNAKHGQLVTRHCEREVHILSLLGIRSQEESCRHHIIYLINIEQKGSVTCLTFPYYSHTLQHYVNQHMDHAFTLRAIQQIAQGLNFLHHRDIIHCDVSPSNILIHEDGHMVLSDFGCAHRLNEPVQSSVFEEVGTRYYKAPEHLFGYRVYTPATDIWSLGAIYGQLLLGKPIFDGETDLEQIGKIIKVLGRPSDAILEREIFDYPDARKFIFFLPKSSKHDDKDKQLQRVLDNHHIDPKDQKLILGMLTWSKQDRISGEEVSCESRTPSTRITGI